VRIIAATNKDLKKEAEAHHFREDLYFRLNVFPIHSPPLRERGNDITLLATHFLKQASQKFGNKDCKLRQSDLKPLLTYDWPGNIRELQNVMERAAITSQQGRVTIDLPLSATNTEATITHAAPTETAIISDDEMQERVKRNMLAALEQCEWKLFGEDGAAVLLNLKPTTLASRIKRLGLKQ
jgi:hydrogenase-4 transcriptional activator